VASRDNRFPPTPGLAEAMRKVERGLRSTNGRDDRPRIHIRTTMDGRVAVRVGLGGREVVQSSIPAAVAMALDMIGHAPAVIFWEGMTDG